MRHGSMPLEQKKNTTMFFAHRKKPTINQSIFGGYVTLTFKDPCFMGQMDVLGRCIGFQGQDIGKSGQIQMLHLGGTM